MSKVKKYNPAQEDSALHMVEHKSVLDHVADVIIYLVVALIAFVCVIPMWHVLMISLSDGQQAMAYDGLFLKWIGNFNLDGYKLIFQDASIISGYANTILYTVSATALGFLIASVTGYALSRETKLKTPVSLILMSTMLFSGGMIANYLVMTKVLMLKNSVWALILPLCMNSFNVIVLRTFFKTSIPDSVVESAKIDGASEWRLFFKIVIPMAMPGLATIGLFLTLGYWNDWFNALMYIDDKTWIPLQFLLMQIQNSIDWLASNKSMMGVDGIQAAANLPKETIKMAIVVISTLPIIFAYPFFQRYFVNGLTIGAVKE